MNNDHVVNIAQLNCLFQLTLGYYVDLYLSYDLKNRILNQLKWNRYKTYFVCFLLPLHNTYKYKLISKKGQDKLKYQQD